MSVLCLFFKCEKWRGRRGAGAGRGGGISFMGIIFRFWAQILTAVWTVLAAEDEGGWLCLLGFWCTYSVFQPGLNTEG